MSDSKWVQHKSGQGEKWEVDENDHGASIMNNCDWAVRGYHLLPKSEYVLCDPPERWIDVTARLEVSENGLNIYDFGQGQNLIVLARDEHYRFRKVQLSNMPSPYLLGRTQWAFIVERRQP